MFWSSLSQCNFILENCIQRLLIKKLSNIIRHYLLCLFSCLVMAQYLVSVICIAMII